MHPRVFSASHPVVTQASSLPHGRGALRASGCAQRSPAINLTVCVRTLVATAALVALNSFGAIPSPEKILPDDTMLMVTVPDFVAMRQVWNKCPQGRLWNDPAMKPFKDKFLARWNEEFAQPLERELGIRIADYASLAQGQATLALTQNGWQGPGTPAPAMLLLIDTKAKQDELKKDLSELRKKWIDSGKSIRTEKIRGVDFSVVPLSGDQMPKALQKVFSQPESDSVPDDKDEKDKAATGKDIILGQFESLLIIGNSTHAVEKIMVRLTGGAMPGLGDMAAYEANRSAWFREAPAYGWANLKLCIDLLTPKPSQSEDEPPNPFAMLNPAKIMAAMGLSGLQTLSMSFRSSDEGSSLQVFVGVPDSSRQGVFKLLPTHGKESSPPMFVPADVVKFRRCRVDGQKAWATLQTMMNAISPQLLSGVNLLLDTANANAKSKDPGFDLRKNLFDNLGDDVITYQKAPKGSSLAELRSPPSLLLLSSPQPDHLAAAIKSLGVLWNADAGNLPEREFLGRKIFSLPVPALPSPTAGLARTAPRTFNGVASGGYVAFSADVSMLEEFLRSSEAKGKTLRDTAGLVEAAAKVGGMSTGWFGYENQAETSRAVFEQLRNVSNSGATNGGFSVPGIPAFTGPQTLKDWMDFSLLPPFEKIGRYFSFSVYSADVNANGLALRWFAPTPPGLKKP